MSTFFKEFPKVDLKYINDNGTPITLSYTDIYRFIDVSSFLNTDNGNYEIIQIEDGERPDILSQRLYDTPDFYWTFFIINENMKNGMSQWPMSTQTLDRHIKNKYANYGVCTIIPIFDQYDNTKVVSNYVNGLDLSYPYLRVKRVTSNYYTTKSESIYTFDSHRSQLWLSNDNDPFFFSDINNDVIDSNKIQIVLTNPYAIGTSEYTSVVELNNAWLDSTLSWYESIFGEYNGEDYRSDVLQSLVFEVNNFYEEGSIAPDYFIDIQTGERLCNVFCNAANNAAPITNYESEQALNDSKRFIRTLKPSIVYSFVDKYKLTLKETGRLAL